MMSNPRALKSLAIYVALVGLPLAGLAAILRAGGSLHAPPPIGGQWRIESAPMAEGTGQATPTLAISQSGEHVEVSLGSLVLRGRFAGDSLAAERRASRPSAPGACFREGGVRLAAHVDTAAHPARMAGVLEAPGCARVALRAVRMPAAAGGR
jgi:hypothetical protein